MSYDELVARLRAKAEVWRDRAPDTEAILREAADAIASLTDGSEP